MNQNHILYNIVVVIWFAYLSQLKQPLKDFYRAKQLC